MNEIFIATDLEALAAGCLLEAVSNAFEEGDRVQAVVIVLIDEL